MSVYESDRICPRCETFTRYVSNNGCLQCTRGRGRNKNRLAMDYPLLLRDRAAAALRGDRFYYTGERCQHRHRAPRYVRSNWCRSCLDWKLYDVPENER